MYKPNKRHLQPLLISNVNDLPEKHQRRLEQSWAGVFYREFFCRLKEDAFAVLFADLPSRPNTPVNVLVSLDALKAGFGWSDEELYDHFVFDVQVRFALGYRDLKEGEFDLRTLYNFRRRLSQYNQTHGTNLLSAAFADITDQQITAFKVHTGKQRMDSTQIASHILDASRLELAVEAVQRLMKASDQQHFAELLAPFSKGDAGQYAYRIKGKEATAEHLLAVGKVLWQLLQGLATDYANEPVYQVVQRFFDENYRVLESQVQTKEPRELGSGSLQSLDDLEATYRQKGNRFYKGYVANLTETCDPDNPLQLITAVQLASNNCEDADLLVEVLPELKERTELETLYADGGYGSPEADEALSQVSVELHQTGIRGKDPNPNKLNLSDLAFELDESNQPSRVTCPGQQTGAVTAEAKGYTAYFDAAICRTCPFLADQRCRARRVKSDKTRFNWAFSRKEFLWAQRRKRYLQLKQQVKNPRTAVEATVRSLKHPFPDSHLPVRGRFRVTCVMVASAAMINIRRIWRYLLGKEQGKASEEAEVESSMITLASAFRIPGLPGRFAKPCFSC
ncbi:MAG: transposase [Anaerolineales bacterium]|jgi:hypothetical protein|nr:transposase [Anaerolineales bacterium]